MSVTTVQPFDHSRFDWYPAGLGGPGQVQRSDGSPRPALRTPLDVFGVHYGGAGASWLDFGDTANELRGIELNHARPTKKPNEYNSASDSASETWEYAGRFEAAHSSGNNSTVWGHLVVYGLETLTEDQAQALIRGVRRARAQCVTAGYITPGHQVLPHQLLPGARTSCPGPLWTNERWWAQIVAPLTPADFDIEHAAPVTTAPTHILTTPPITVPQGAPDMFIFVVTNAPDSPVAKTWLICDGTQLSHITNGHAAAVYQAVTPQVDVVRASGADQLAGLIGSTRTMNDCPPEWVGTGWEITWTAQRA